MPLMDFIHKSLELLSFLFIVFIGVLFVVVLFTYVLDVTQNRQAIRRNYPVIGRFRYLFEHLGEFFRQYFFAQDREELPFNRAIRGWAYKASKNESLTLAFGSTRPIHLKEELFFGHSAFPVLEEHARDIPEMVIGADCPTPYIAPSVLNISGMSYGALSKVAVQALSRGAAKANCWMNTGEGGLSPYHLEGNCDIVFQIGTANYGVRDQDGNLSLEKLAQIAAHKQVKMFEIKLSQGAKPGKGGMLPGDKITEEIAEIRGIDAGVPSYSPNRPKNISNNTDLLDHIQRIRETTGKPVGIKFALGQPDWITSFLQAVVERGEDCAPDFVTVDGAEGGSGAAPQPLLDFVGLSLFEALPIVVNQLEAFNLRERVKVIASGKLISPARAATALALGADFITSARGFMFSLGCIQALQCNKNTCPTGITTHKAKLQKGLDPTVKSNRVANYHQNLVKSVNMIAHSCGATHARQLGPEHVRVNTGNGTSLAFSERIKFVN